MKIRISSDASAVSGKKEKPAAWCAVLEWKQDYCKICDTPGGSFAMAVTGRSDSSVSGVLGAEIAGVLSGLKAARFLVGDEDLKSTSLDLYVDNAQVDRTARGVTPPSAPGKKTPSGIRGSLWRDFSSLAGLFPGGVSIQWRPRNTTWGLEIADKISGQNRIHGVTFEDPAAVSHSCSIYLVDPSFFSSSEVKSGPVPVMEMEKHLISKARTIRP